MSGFIYAYDFVEFLPMKSDSITCNRQSSNFPFNTLDIQGEKSHKVLLFAKLRLLFDACG